MQENPKEPLTQESTRESFLSRATELFKEKAIEGHLFGSLARGNFDEYSDIDVGFTFKDEDLPEILKNRLDYYTQVGEIIHICEAPQNAPIGGVQSGVTYRAGERFVTVDYSLAPLSTSFMSEEGKKLFGADLPIGVMGYNPNKVEVDESYRVDFLIGFILNSIKRLHRHRDNTPLSDLFKEYGYLQERYGIPVEPLVNPEHSFDSLKQVIVNTKKVANEKQKETLGIISGFLDK